MTDQQLLQLIREKKHSPALDQLYAYYDSVKASVLAHGGSPEDAKDIFQQGLMIFCEQAVRPDFQIHSTVENFLFGTCRYLWINTLRKRKKTTGFSQDQVADFSAEAVSLQLEREEKLTALEQVLAQLGETCRKLLELTYFRKTSMREIAQMLGYQNENTAKTRKYKCMEHARKLAAQHPVSLQTVHS